MEITNSDWLFLTGGCESLGASTDPVFPWLSPPCSSQDSANRSSRVISSYLPEGKGWTDHKAHPGSLLGGPGDPTESGEVKNLILLYLIYIHNHESNGPFPWNMLVTFTYAYRPCWLANAIELCTKQRRKCICVMQPLAVFKTARCFLIFANQFSWSIFTGPSRSRCYLCSFQMRMWFAHGQTHDKPSVSLLVMRCMILEPFPGVVRMRVYRFTWNLHGLKVMMIESFP